MIGSLRGTVIERTTNGEVLIDVHGVGYRCHMPVSELNGLDPAGEVTLITHLHVREDAMVLYAFITRDARDTFESLITVNGVGPKLALAILGVHSPDALRACLAADDVNALCLVPGVGKRTAQRLLIDLKAKLSMPDIDLAAIGGAADARGMSLHVRAEVREALDALGYSNDEIRTALSEIRDDAAVETALREALRTLGARR